MSNCKDRLCGADDCTTCHPTLAHPRPLSKYEVVEQLEKIEAHYWDEHVALHAANREAEAITRSKWWAVSLELDKARERLKE